jgi:hypothetical protein
VLGLSTPNYLEVALPTASTMVDGGTFLTLTGLVVRGQTGNLITLTGGRTITFTKSGLYRITYAFLTQKSSVYGASHGWIQSLAPISYRVTSWYDTGTGGFGMPSGAIETSFQAGQMLEIGVWAGSIYGSAEPNRFHFTFTYVRELCGNVAGATESPCTIAGP